LPERASACAVRSQRSGRSLKGLEEAERAAGWPQRAGKVVLQLALTRLARHYGIGPATGASPRAGAVRHWGSDDYRPPFDISAE
jgi:uncharacterized protein DUF6456